MQAGYGKTYKWTWKNKRMYCSASSEASQTLTNLWEVEELSSFHDAGLAIATKEINAILKKVEANNRDPKRKLSFIQFENRHLLVWARYGVTSSNDDDDSIIKAFKLKAE